MTLLTRRTTNTAWPRHTTFNICPASSLEASTSTGAPSALARALGFHDARKGMAANAAPITPVPTVAVVSNRRRLWSTSSTSSLMRNPQESVDKSLRKPLRGQCFPKNIGSALYTDTRPPFKARGAILIAEHSCPRFLGQSGHRRIGCGLSRGLVESHAAGRAHRRGCAGRRYAGRRYAERRYDGLCATACKY